MKQGVEPRQTKREDVEQVNEGVALDANVARSYSWTKREKIG